MCYDDQNSVEINVLIDTEFQGDYEISWLQHIAKQVLITQDTGSNMELSLVITGQERVQQLNYRYRGKDEPTDVLAFSALEEVEKDFPPFIPPPDGVRHLGEVIISYPQAAIQAKERRHSQKKEIVILIIHGVLHLLGYEHDKPGLKRQMTTRETEIISHIGSEMINPEQNKDDT